MKAVNLHLLTRIHDEKTLSMMLKALSGRRDGKEVSHHEAATLWCLTDRICACLTDGNAPDAPSADGSSGGSAIESAAQATSQAAGSSIALLDGFYFSFTIAHIGKEFDLLKASAAGDCVLNIELKSEKVEEERIKKQLEQNRYYLSHIARTIYSFTYVMETNQLYVMNEKGFLRECGMEELLGVLQKDALQDYLGEGIEQYFKAADYLISPIASPEKFLQGKYFLTNQQFDFRRRVLEQLQKKRDSRDQTPVISISGVAGTGKTLLLLDLALALSKKQRVLFLHSGPLRQGHLTIHSRLKNVDIHSVDLLSPDEALNGYDFCLVDEADHLSAAFLRSLLTHANEAHIPVIMAYDPHQLLAGGGIPQAEESVVSTLELIMSASTLTLCFSGNIRINRPVYSFLRTLLNLKDRPGEPDYSCIEVLYANDEKEQEQIIAYCKERGFALLSCSGAGEKEGDMIAREYDKVLMVLDDSFYYDEALHLRVKGDEAPLRILYEGLSRTRDSLCLLVKGNQDLFGRILSIRVGQPLSCAQSGTQADAQSDAQSETQFVAQPDTQSDAQSETPSGDQSDAPSGAQSEIRFGTHSDT